MTFQITFADQDGDERSVPAKLAICDSCNGTGTTSSHLGSYTSEEFAEAFDPEEAEAYFKGSYDKKCSSCHPSYSGRILVVNEDACPKEDLEEYWEDLESSRLAYEEQQAEIRMGA